MIIKAGHLISLSEEKLEENSLVLIDSPGTDNAFLCSPGLILLYRLMSVYV